MLVETSGMRVLGNLFANCFGPETGVKSDYIDKLSVRFIALSKLDILSV